MKRRLPLSFQKNLNGYLLYAFPYCILDACESGRIWLMDHYFQPCSYINENDDINIEILDGISYGKFHKPFGILQTKFYQDTDDILYHIKNSIDHMEYVVVFIDESERANTYYRYLHEIMIFAYEDDIFTYVAFDQANVFTEMKISAFDLVRAFVAGKCAPSTLAADWARDRRIINFTMQDTQYKTDEKLAFEHFRWYSQGGVCEKISTDNKCATYTMYQGLDSTRLFLETIERYREKYIEHIPYAGFHLLYETKKLLLQRMNFHHLFSDVQAYTDIISHFNVARVHALKTIIGHEADVNKIYDSLYNGYDKECRLLR